MAIDDVKLAAVRRLAEFEALSAVESRSKLIDEHHSAFRWIVASLFALNGGAILALLGKGDFGIEPILGAFWFFFAGIISTFSTVILAQISDRLMISQMHNWGLYWTTVCVTGKRDEENEKGIKQGISKAEGWGRRARQFAMLAMTWFVLGVLATIVLRQENEIRKIEAKLNRLEAAEPKQ